MKTPAILNFMASSANFMAWQWGGHSDVNLFFCGLGLGLGLAFAAAAFSERAA